MVHRSDPSSQKDLLDLQVPMNRSDHQIPPSTSPQKPGGTLPKTNMTDSSLGMWIGSFLVAGVLLVVGSKKRKAISKN